uniref:Uncharacterized protein n=1 Tax=Panagrolaimus superbus TaxID=310955 RepID=A0A914XTB8_9BILA
MTDVEKVRSAEKEADLDRKIEQIRRRNEEIEERHKLVTEEAIQNGIPKSFQKATVNGGHQKMSGSNHTNLKTSETISSTKKGNGIAETKGNQWGREWDRGKTSAEDWKMNVPEFGDHGNSYFKTDGGANGSNNTTTSSRGRGGAGGRGGGHHFQQHQQQRGGGGAGAGRRPGQQGTNKSAPHNPGFFHDDRFDKAKTDENDGIDSAAAPPSADGKQLETNKKIPARNNNHPRKPATMHQKSFENDKNQNDSSKPNMNVSNGYGTRQDYRGGRGGAGAGATPPHRNIFNPSRRGGAPPSSGGSGGPIRQSSNHNTINGINGNQNTSNKFDHQRKTMPKNDGTKPQNFKDSNAATADKHLPSNRGRNFKPFNKPPHYSNQRQNKGLYFYIFP